MILTEKPLKNKSPLTETQIEENEIAYRQWRDEIAQLLQDNGFFDEAERWDYCDDSPRYKINRKNPVLPEDIKTVWICSESCDHDAVLFSPTCDNRVCPECASRHVARLLAKYVPFIGELIKKYPKYRLRTIVFTRVVKLGDVDFKKTAQKGFTLIQKAMRKVVGASWNKNGAGMLVNWEVGSNGLKLHYHAVYFGNWVDQRKLSTAWGKLTGDSYVVWVGGVKQNDGDWQKSVSYTLKYSVKFYSHDPATGKRKYLSPELTLELFSVLKGTRRIRSYGSLYSIGEPPERLFACSDCGAEMIRIGIAFWDIWVKTGFSPLEWSEMVSKPLLHLSIANKSPPQRTKMNNSVPTGMELLPGFDKVRVKGSLHYEYEC